MTFDAITRKHAPGKPRDAFEQIDARFLKEVETLDLKYNDATLATLKAELDKALLQMPEVLPTVIKVVTTVVDPSTRHIALQVTITPGKDPAWAELWKSPLKAPPI